MRQRSEGLRKRIINHLAAISKACLQTLFAVAVLAGNATAQQPSCTEDFLTVDSLQAAQAAYQSGAQDISISPGGCLRYQRLMPPVGPGFQTLTFAGQTVVTWTHLRPMDDPRFPPLPYAISIGYRDGDMDGFFETLIQVAGSTAQIIDVNPVSNEVTRRRSYIVGNDGIVHVVVEQGPSPLRVVAEYDLPLNIEENERVSEKVAEFSIVTCPPGMPDQVASARLSAVVNGGNCLRNLQMNGVVASMALAALTRPFQIQCFTPTTDDERGTLAWISSRSLIDPALAEPLTLFVNVDAWQDASRRERRLFHELLHTALSEDHPYEGEPALDALARTNYKRYLDQDRVSSCASVCYAPDATRCECARCQGTTRCSSECQRYRECASTQVGGICPCPANNRRWFESLNECAGECSSGLQCFGIQCIPEAPNPCK